MSMVIHSVLLVMLCKGAVDGWPCIQPQSENVDRMYVATSPSNDGYGAGVPYIGAARGRCASHCASFSWYNRCSPYFHETPASIPPWVKV